MNAMKMFAAVGGNGVLNVAVSISDNQFEWGAIKANISVSLMMSGNQGAEGAYEMDTLTTIRGTLRHFNKSGDDMFDMSNSMNKQFPNSVIYGVEELLNIASISKIYNGLKEKNAKRLELTLQWDGTKWTNWTGTKAVGNVALASAAVSLIDSAMKEVTVQVETPKEENKKDKAAKAFQKK